MKFIKVLIGIFAVIGVIVVCLGIGFLFGMKNQTTTSVPDEPTVTPVVTENLIPEPTVTSVPTPTSEPEPTVTSAPTPTSTPVPTATVAPTATSIPTPTVAPTATSTPTPTIAVESPTEYTYRDLNEVKVVNENFNIFTDASGNGTSKGIIDASYLISVTKQCNETGWYGITANQIDTELMAITNTIEGFIHPDVYKTLSDYGTQSSDSSAEEKETYTFTDMSIKMVPIGKVNVRDLPSSEGNKLDTISEGKVVMVTGKCNETGWYSIKYYSNNLDKQVYGYADSSYFTEDVEPTATPTPKPAQNNNQNQNQNESTNNTDEKPVATPKPTTTPSQSQSSGTFTGTVLVTVGTGKDRHQEEVQATGTKQVNGYTIYENLGEDTYVVLEGSADMKNSKINEVYRAYEAIYGDHIGETATDNGDVVFIIKPTAGEKGELPTINRN